MEKELIIVLDFGGQYNQLIARRVRECNVYAEVHPYTLPIEKIKEMNPKGIIFTGGPNSVYDPASPSYTADILEAGIPILGICYGAQLIAHLAGGKVATAPVSEYGKTETFIDAIDEEDGVLGQVSLSSSLIFDNIKPVINTWMSHTDYIAELPKGFHVTAHTNDCPVAGMENEDKAIYAVQFHPEVMHSEQGKDIL